MHKLLNKKSKITIEDFYIEYEEDEVYFKDIIHNLNRYRKKYLDENVTNKVKYLRKAKAMLPESYLQTRTVSTNYQELRNIYFQRKNHRLDKEWGLFIKWIESLPYAKELITL